MSSRRVLATLLAIMFVLSLVSCSSGNNAASDNTKTTEAADQTTAAKTGEATKEEAVKPVEIVVTYNNVLNPGAGGTIDEVLKKREDDIESGKFPELKDPSNVYAYDFTKVLKGIMDKENIKVSYVDWGWDEPLIKKETAAFMSGDGPDVIIGETQMPGFAMQNVLEPFPDWLDKEVRESIVIGAYKGMEVGGKLYGVAPRTSCSVLFRNKTILKSVGIDPEKAPATWAELLDMCEKVKENGKGEYYAGGFYAGPNAGGWLRVGPFMAINGGGFVDENNNPIFNSEKNIEPFQFMRDLCKVNPNGFTYPNSEDPFRKAWDAGKMAFMEDGQWNIQFSKAKGIDYGISDLPLSPTGKKGNVLIGATIFGVTKYSKNKEAAFKYISAMLSQEAQSLAVKSDGCTPVVKSLVENSDYKTSYPEKFMFYQGLQGDVVGLPTFTKESSKTWAVFSDAMIKTVTTDQPIKEILDAAQAEAMKLQQ